MMGRRCLSAAERRARNRSLTSLLWTPPAYPGYSSCLGSLTRVEPSGIITFQPYGDEESSVDYENCLPLDPGHRPTFTIATPPLCSPEDDSEFQDELPGKSRPNASISSGYGSAGSESDQEFQLPMSQSCYFEGSSSRASRLHSRREREAEKWRRRSVPAAPRHALPEDVMVVLSGDGHVNWETDVDTGERIAMEVRGVRRPESVMQLARRFAEISAAQEKELHKSRNSLDGKENRTAAKMSARPNMFKQMEKVGAGTAAPPRQLNPNSIKEALLRWVQNRVQDYPNVSVTNFSSSWADGMAFCALIHRFAPDAFDFSKLDPKNRRHNFELAFKVAEDNGICPLLEVDDMIMMGDRPDWKCVFTYVQCFYKQFRQHP